MPRLQTGLITAVLTAAMCIAAAAQKPAPYKLGMFEQNGRSFVGLVVQNDTQVIDLVRAINAPSSLKQMITAWDAKMDARLAALASKPGGTIPVKQLKTLPPIPDPSVLLNVAV